ncbi:MAG: glycosyltransferase [Nitriliruptorales bacterium]|nr:glycosyltransferase [Nitriliruptorales bacterium]
MSAPDLRTRRADLPSRPPRATTRRRLPTALRSHWLFAVLFALGFVLRVITQVAYRPALLYIDSFSYLRDMTELVPRGIRPLGYPFLLLRPLSVFGDLAVFALANHLLGLAMAVAIYAVLLRHGSPRWLGALATAPVLLDAYQLQIEQNVLAETLFQALVLAGLVLLIWHRRLGPLVAGVAGLLLGLSVTVRLVGQPLIVPAVLFLLLAGGSWRRRLTNAVVVALCFALPVVGYGLVYQQEHGEFAFNAVGGRVQYARVARFADCQAVSLPEHLRPLCPTPREQEELTPDEFAWTDSPARRYEPPPGVHIDDALGDFAGRVRMQQPLDYVGAVAWDFAKFFQWSKTQLPEDPPLERWQFQIQHPEFPYPDPQRRLETAVETHGGSGPAVSEPLTRFLRAYQLGGGYTPGPLLLVALLAGAAGALGLGRARRTSLRAPCLLFTLAGGGLLLAASLFEFSWRYQLPGLVLLPVAGALGMTALLGRAPAVGRTEAADVPGAVDEAALDDFHARYGRVRLAPVVIVIAAYNEADGIGPVLDQLPERACDVPVDVVVVDDGSSDETAKAAIAHGAYTCVVPRNRGQGAALRLGYRIAREGGADFVVTTDADGQYDPTDIPLVLEPIVRGQADFVTGSRRLGRAETDDRLRRLGVRAFASLVSAMTGQRITDTSNGLRAMRAEITGAVTLSQPQYQASELLIGVLAGGYHVAERPTTLRRRSAGSTKKGNNLVYGFRYARVVLSTWWRERRSRRSANSSRSNTTNLPTNSRP